MTIAILIARFFVKEDNPERGVYMYALAFANSGYMGDPIVSALFGEIGLAYYKIYCLPVSIAIYTWGIATLVPKDKRQGNVLKKLINAPTVALFLGMIVGLSGLGSYIPQPVSGALSSLKACMGPVAMLLAGFTIASYDFVGMLKKYKVYIATVLRLAVIPAVIIGVMFGLKELVNLVFDLSIDNTALFLTFFAVATPLGLNTVVFPEAFGGNPETGASMAMISHTLCVLSIPLMYSVMVSIFGSPIF